MNKTDEYIHSGMTYPSNESNFLFATPVNASISLDNFLSFTKSTKTLPTWKSNEQDITVNHFRISSRNFKVVQSLVSS